MKLEIAVDSYESLINAQNGGADRIELCSALEIGGLTPSYGLIKQASKLEDIEVFVMIRPRSGDFYYNSTEIETMKLDIDAVKQAHLDGIVIGILDQEGRLDIDKFSEIVEYAKPLKVSLHRAFDVAKNSEDDIEKLIDIGIIRILTSGKMLNAPSGSNLITSLQKSYGNKIEIMPGSGVTSDNLEELYKTTGCKSYHMSGKKKVQSKLKYRSEIKFSEDDYSRNVTDEEEVRKSKEILEKLEKSMASKTSLNDINAQARKDTIEWDTIKFRDLDYFKDHIIAINFESLAFQEMTYNDLYNYVKEFIDFHGYELKEYSIPIGEKKKEY